ncbi:helix-turn-helix domain-containing protein [Dyadobacter sp. SG02]|uniref:response regulator transcription factor n=1 Tax=Dyadobacter sp. SG02 TaxID=1855291 RepID=UPI001E5C8B3A|nr:helix-turn-helix domain-containing protein [Dyadobacter sp. SG02]
MITVNTDLRIFGRGILGKYARIIETNNGKEGIEYARKMSPILILCDVSIPLANGFEICGGLKSDEATSHIAVILLGQEGQEIEGLHSGADDFIVRPFNSKILGLKIGNIVRSREALRGRFAQEIALQSGDFEGGLLEKLKQLVNDNISDPDFGVHEMAFQIGISVSVLYRKLRLLAGVTVNDFVKTIRMNRAMQLLRVGVYQVNEVATAVGYEDSKYFSREFRKTFGETPAEVKRHGSA